MHGESTEQSMFVYADLYEALCRLRAQLLK